MQRVVQSRSHNSKQPAQMAKEVVFLPTGKLTPFPGNPRKHPKAQISNLMRAITNGWTNPILIDDTNTVLCGHGRLEAAKRLQLKKVPTLRIIGLSSASKQALLISDNKLGEQAVWDLDLLKSQLRELVDLDFDVELTGFSTGEVDILLDGPPPKKAATDPDDHIDGDALHGPTISIIGDLWHLGPHRLLCGDALLPSTFDALMSGELAQMAVADPPYNVRIDGHARGKGKIRQREFAMASGEMKEPQFVQFLGDSIRPLIRHSVDGSIHYLFMDWRHLDQLTSAAKARYTEQKNLLVWVKDNGGMGSFYRSRHELIAVYKNGTGPHINNFGLGDGGRYRTNVLEYPGVNALVGRSREEMDAHPTVKPVALIADLIRDCSRRNGIILDPFCGSGTVILAAERTGRAARAIEIDPMYVDLGIRRWERATGQQARHACGNTFAEVAADRAGEHDSHPRKAGR